MTGAGTSTVTPVPTNFLDRRDVGGVQLDGAAHRGTGAAAVAGGVVAERHPEPRLPRRRSLGDLTPEALEPGIGGGAVGPAAPAARQVVDGQQPARLELARH